jgi:hypothetical protein
MKGARWLAWPVLLVFLMLGPAMGADEQPPQEQPSNDQSAGDEQSADDAPMDSEALDALNRMAETLAQAQGFSVTIRAGKAITVFNPGDNVYGQIEKAGSVDDTVRFVIQDLGMPLPLALMLVTTLPDELDRPLQSIDYVERDTLTPAPTDHLAGRAADVDFEVWLDTGDTPLPQRLAITYKTEEGEPQYRAEFSDWKLNPDVSQVELAFNPPDGAQRIPFLVRVRRHAADQSPGTGEAPADKAPADGKPAESGSTEGPSK